MKFAGTGKGKQPLLLPVPDMCSGNRGGKSTMTVIDLRLSCFP